MTQFLNLEGETVPKKMPGLCDFCDTPTGHLVEHGHHLFQLCAWHTTHLNEKGWRPDLNKARFRRVWDEVNQKWEEIDQSVNFKPILLS